MEFWKTHASPWKFANSDTNDKQEQALLLTRRWAAHAERQQEKRLDAPCFLAEITFTGAVEVFGAGAIMLSSSN